MFLMAGSHVFAIESWKFEPCKVNVLLNILLINFSNWLRDLTNRVLLRNNLLNIIVISKNTHVLFFNANYAYI